MPHYQAAQKASLYLVQCPQILDEQAIARQPICGPLLSYPKLERDATNVQ